MTNDSSFSYWIDHLAEKHECFRYQPRIETIEINGESVELHVPDWAPPFELVTAAEKGTLLFLILRDLRTTGWEDNLGIVVVASELVVQQPNHRSYKTVVWHQTYPYLWRHLSSPGIAAE